MEQLQTKQQVVYQADTNVMQTMKKTRERLQQICTQCMNRPVRVQMENGQMVEGMVANVDQNYLYLSVPDMSHATCHSCQQQRIYPFSPYGYSPYYYNNVILPLVLFDLLVITLI